MKRILVIAAHPDDELLGCGGTMRKEAEAGNEISALILGEGCTSRYGSPQDAGEDRVLELHQDTMRAGEIIGYSNRVFFENLPDNRFDQVDLLDIVKKVEKRVEQYQPDIIYTHHEGDLNIDHRITFQAVLTATRPLGNRPVREVYAFETLSSSEWNFSCGSACFRPNVFRDITEQIDKKCAAMCEYKTELREFPHPRSIEGIRTCAKRWATAMGGGAIYAEAFELIRLLN